METQLKKIDLAEKAKWVRKQTLEMCAYAGSGHLASSLSCVEILVALYYGRILRFDSADPNWEERDRFILSKGHGGVALYPILADLGFLPNDDLGDFCQPGSILGVHPDKNVPGIETTTGSLGHGLGIAVGLALCAKMDKKSYSTVCLLGDGECYAGSIWEAAMFAGHLQLNNLIAIADRNRLCVTDFTENFLRLEPFQHKWISFGWDVACINGHCFEEIFAAFKNSRSRSSAKPLIIIANTIKGKGLSCMEDSPHGHTLVPSGEQLEIAKRELG